MDERSIISIRLSPDLSQWLERVAERLQQDREALVEQAIREYLQKVNHAELAEEARRQSLLALAADVDDNVWERNGDTQGWEA